jgi:hypothetical protein
MRQRKLLTPAVAVLLLITALRAQDVQVDASVSADTVAAGDQDSRASSRPSQDEVFVVAEFDRTWAYPGQQATLTYLLLTHAGVTGIQVLKSPPLTGFWVEELEVAPSPGGARRTIGGREYVEYAVRKQALFSNAPGKLAIPPSTFAISAKSAGDFFGIFGQAETLYRKTKEAYLEVRPLPREGRPADFGNAVGSFNLTSNLDKNAAATGEAVALTVKLSGRGNLKMITDIPLPALPDFTIYPAKHAENVRPFEGDLIGGDETWEYVIVPKAPGRQQIPPLSISYFDPERQQYETLHTLPLDLEVVRGPDGGGDITALSGLSKQNLIRQASDINFIKLATDDLGGRSGPAYGAVWFCILATVPLAFNIAMLLHRRKQALRSGDAVLARSLGARRAALARLKRAETAGRIDARRFYDEAAGALGRYLADRFNLPGIALTADTLERVLEEHSADRATVTETLSCMEECDFARFAGSSAAPVRTREIVARVRRIIHTLERL